MVLDRHGSLADDECANSAVRITWPRSTSDNDERTILKPPSVLAPAVDPADLPPRRKVARSDVGGEHPAFRIPIVHDRPYRDDEAVAHLLSPVSLNRLQDGHRHDRSFAFRRYLQLSKKDMHVRPRLELPAQNGSSKSRPRPNYLPPFLISRPRTQHVWKDRQDSRARTRVVDTGFHK